MMQDDTFADSGTRSDVEIARSAENLLRGMKNACGNAVKVSVERGWLTLSGEVGSDYERQCAAGVVVYLLGVTGLSDQIRIRPGKFAGAMQPESPSAAGRAFP
jgi:osmotically-inducible protein OsmY